MKDSKDTLDPQSEKTGSKKLLERKDKSNSQIMESKPGNNRADFDYVSELTLYLSSHKHWRYFSSLRSSHLCRRLSS